MMEKMLAIGLALSLYDKMTPGLNSVGGSIENLEAKITKFGDKLRGFGAKSLAIGTAITAPLGVALNSYQDLARAQGEIASLGIRESGIADITKAAREFSNEFAGTTAPEFISASYDIKSGISSLKDKAVGEFTKIAAMTGAATKSSTSEMTSLFATGFGIYRGQFNEFGSSVIEGWENLSDEEKDIKFGEYFSGGFASAVQTFKTTGANMSAAISNLGATATSANVSFEEQLAILGTLQATMSGSEAATKYRAFLGSAAKASDALGLSFMDANNQLLTMPEIIGQIKEKYGETIDALEAQELKKAFGTDEAVSLITLMYDKTDSLKTNIEELGASLEDGTTKTKKMALDINKGKEFELLGQQLNNLSSLIGQTFAPAALWLGKVIGEVVMSVSTWMEENQTLASVIGTGVAILGAALVVIGSTALAIGTVTMALGPLKIALAGTVIAFKALGTIIAFVGKAFLFNPIGIAVAAIAGAAYLIYSNWDFLKEWFSGFFDGLAKQFAWVGSAIDKLKSVGGAVMDFFGFGGKEDVEVNANKNLNIANQIQEKPLKIGDGYLQGEQNATARITPATSSDANMLGATNQFKSSENTGGNIAHNNYDVKINVNNPNSNVDVEKAIKKALAEEKRDKQNRGIE